MNYEKINLDTELNLNRLKARVFILLKKLPPIWDNEYESIVRQLVRDNFTAEKLERFEDHFILFSIGRPSVFDQIVGIE